MWSNSRAFADIENIKKGLEKYYSDYSQYPPTGSKYIGAINSISNLTTPVKYYEEYSNNPAFADLQYYIKIRNICLHIYPYTHSLVLILLLILCKARNLLKIFIKKLWIGFLSNPIACFGLGLMYIPLGAISIYSFLWFLIQFYRNKKGKVTIHINEFFLSIYLPTLFLIILLTPKVISLFLDSHSIGNDSWRISQGDIFKTNYELSK